jgi:hypothetical protein
MRFERLKVGDLVHVKGHNTHRGVVLNADAYEHSKTYRYCRVYWFHDGVCHNVPVSMLRKIEVVRI